MDFYNLREEDQEDFLRCTSQKKTDMQSIARFQLEIDNRSISNITFENDEVFLVDKIHQHGWSTLLWACFWGRRYTINILLRSGADPNFQSRDDSAPSKFRNCSVLTMAISQGDYLILRIILLLARPRVERDLEGRNPFELFEKIYLGWGHKYYQNFPLYQALVEGTDVLTMTVYSIGHWFHRWKKHPDTEIAIGNFIMNNYVEFAKRTFIKARVPNALRKGVELGLIKPGKPFILTERGEQIYIEEQERLKDR